MTVKGARPSWRRISRELGRHKQWALLVGASTVLEVGFSSIIPLAVARAIDAVAHQQQYALTVNSIVFVASLLADSVAIYAVQRTSTRFAQEYLFDLRGRLLDHLFLLDLDYFERQRVGRIVARLTSDVDNLQQFLEGGLTNCIRAVLVLGATLGILTRLSPQLTAAILVLLVPLVPLTRWYVKRIYTAQLAIREINAEQVTVVSESLSTIDVVQAYGLEARRSDALSAANAESVRRKMRAAKLNSIYQAGLDAIPVIALATTAGAGWVLIRHGHATLTAVIASVFYVARLFDPLQQLLELTNVMQSASASFAKIFGFVEHQPGVQDSHVATPMMSGPGTIDICSVSFSYGGGRGDVLHDITLHIHDGERLALIGGSGAGKSTLAKLLARFYDPTSGELLVNGQNLKSLQQQSLRRHLALVPQDGFLFDGTVRQNIALGRFGARREDVDLVCQRLGILELLTRSLPEGLDTEITAGGASLSSGQRQLVALARAMLADPSILILDEATSHLDPATDEIVEQAMATLFEGRTAVVIAHRVNTALRADRVVLLDHGRIVEAGLPQDLLAAGGEFARWVRAEQVAPATSGPPDGADPGSSLSEAESVSTGRLPE